MKDVPFIRPHFHLSCLLMGSIQPSFLGRYATIGASSSSMAPDDRFELALSGSERKRQQQRRVGSIAAEQVQSLPLTLLRVERFDPHALAL